MELRDDVLIGKWKAGDEAALSALVRKHRPEVEGACRQYFIDQPDAGDLALDAASIVLQKGVELFDPSRGKFSTYLDHLIRSVCVDKQRSLAGVEEHRREKRERLKSAARAACARCGMPVLYLRTGKVAYNNDGVPHDKTCAASPGCAFPNHAPIKRSRNFKFDSSVGRAESERTSDDGDVFDTDPWDAATARYERYSGFDDEAGGWYFAPRLSDYRIIIERVITKRAGGTPDEDDDDAGETEDLSWGAFLFDDDTPTFLYDIPVAYLSAMLEMSKGAKLAEISNATGTPEDTIKRYFNRLKAELRVKAAEKKKQSRPKGDPAIAKLKNEFTSWRNGAGARIDPFDKNKLR